MSTDKEFLNEVWCRGIFLKENLKKAQLISTLVNHPYVFENIPATSIKFDPYAVAPFSERPAGKVFFKESDKQVLWDWSHGMSIKDLHVHAMQLNRLARKYIRENLESDFHFSHTT